MKNPDAVKEALSAGERELLHGFLMQGLLYPGAEIRRQDLPRHLPGFPDAATVVDGLVAKQVFEAIEGGAFRCLTLAYQVADALTAEDLVSAEAGLLHGPPPGWTWPIENPNNTPWSVEDSFLQATTHLDKDARLRAELLKAMAAVLRNPRYGKPQRGPRSGQRNARVARNFRLFWTHDGREVVFLEFGSKEDPHIAPRGK